MQYFDDILNVYAYMFSKSKKLVEDAAKITEGIVKLTDDFKEIGEKSESINAAIDADILTLRALAEEWGVDVSDIPSAATDTSAPMVPATVEKLEFGKMLKKKKNILFQAQELISQGKLNSGNFSDVRMDELVKKIDKYIEVDEG